MEYELSISPTRNYITITFYVPMTTEVACRCGPELVRLAAENNIKRFLFDVRQSANEQSVTKNYNFAYKDIAEFGFPRISQSAFLVGEDDGSHDFITTAFLNAGYCVRLFHDEISAIKWLAEGAGS